MRTMPAKATRIVGPGGTVGILGGDGRVLIALGNQVHAVRADVANREDGVVAEIPLDVEVPLVQGGSLIHVVVHRLAVRQAELRGRRVDRLHHAVDPLDVLRRERRGEVHARLLRLAPAHGDPRVGRRELEVRVAADQRDAVRLADALLHLVCAGHATEARSHDHDVCHNSPCSSGRPRPPCGCDS